MRRLFFGFFILFIFSNQGLAAINRPPTVSSQNVSTDEDTSFTIIFTGSDPEGAALTYSIVTDPAKGSLSCSTNDQCVYTPVANINGSDRFSIRAYDGSVYSRLAWIQITINAVNDPPTVEGAVMEVIDIGSITLVGSDIEGSALSFSVSDSPSHGDASIAGNILTYKAWSDFSGPDELSIIATDGLDQSSPAVVTITVIDSNTIVPIEMSDLELISDAITTASENKIVVTMASHECHIFTTEPIIVPLRLADESLSEAVVHTFHSLCGGYQDVTNYTFVVNTQDGQAYHFIKEREANYQFDALGVPLYLDSTGLLVLPLVSTNVEAEDEDAPTGGIGIVEDGVPTYVDPFEGRLIPSLISVDGTLIVSTQNLPVPTCQTGQKIDAEKCGIFGIIDPSGAVLANSIGNAYEINQSAAMTHVVMNDSQGNIINELLAWGTGWAGNIGDPADMDGACSIFVTNKDDFMNAGYNNTLNVFDFLGEGDALWADTGDPGCTVSLANSSTPLDAIQGEITVGFNPDTGRPLFWAKAALPDVAGSDLTPITLFDEDLNTLCSVSFKAGVQRNPFATNSGVVIGNDGMMYTSASYFDANNVLRIGIFEVDPKGCGTKTLLELNSAVAGGPFSDVTLAQNAAGDTLVLGSAGGYLYLVNVTTGQYTTHVLANTDTVIAGPVIDSFGHVIVMSKTYVMTIFSDLVDTNNTVVSPLGDLSYGDHFWPRARQNNLGTATVNVVPY